jgi:chaperonin GroES
MVKNEKAAVLNLLSNRVAVLPAPVAEMTKGGLVLPEDAKEKPTRGTVVAVGPGFRDTGTGLLTTTAVSVGQIVLYGKFAGHGRQVEHGGQTLVILDESEIMAVVG